MEQPCYKCGQTVEEGVAFCPHCSAPQIRVVMAEPAPQPLAFTGAAATEDSEGLPASQTVPVLAVPVRWSQALKPCALAALAATVLGLLHLYPLVVMLSAGFLAVIFYRQARASGPIKVLSGLRLGALGGFLFFVLTSLLAALGAAVPEVRANIREQIIEYVKNVAASRPGDPQIQSLLDQLKTPDGFVGMLVALGVLFFLFSIVLGGLGGALGGFIFGRRDRP